MIYKLATTSLPTSQLACQLTFVLLFSRPRCWAAGVLLPSSPSIDDLSVELKTPFTQLRRNRNTATIMPWIRQGNSRMTRMGAKKMES